MTTIVSSKWVHVGQNTAISPKNAEILSFGFDKNKVLSLIYFLNDQQLIVKKEFSEGSWNIKYQISPPPKERITGYFADSYKFVPYIMVNNENNLSNYAHIYKYNASHSKWKKIGGNFIDEPGRHNMMGILFSKYGAPYIFTYSPRGDGYFSIRSRSKVSVEKEVYEWRPKGPKCLINEIHGVFVAGGFYILDDYHETASDKAGLRILEPDSGEWQPMRSGVLMPADERQFIMKRGPHNQLYLTYTANVPIYSGRQSISKAIVMTYNKEEGWEKVGTPGLSVELAEINALDFDKSGTPYVAHSFEGFYEEATVQKFNGKKWVFVDDVGFSDGPVSNITLSLSPQDIPYVAYVDSKHEDQIFVKKQQI